MINDEYITYIIQTKNTLIDSLIALKLIFHYEQ